MKKVLIVEDEKIACDNLGQFLLKKGYSPSCAYTFAEAREQIRSERHDIYLVDVRLPDGNGLELIPAIRGALSDAIIIILTAYATVENAVSALKSGADHYLIKPIDLEELLVVVRKEERLSVQQKTAALGTETPPLAGHEDLIGTSRVMLPVLDLIKRLCLSDASVLITGESGTGKELAARTLHYSGPRGKKRFVPVNCAALPEPLLESELFGHVKGAFTGALQDREGKFEYADGGTLFLDEIGELGLALQAKFLRILEQKSFVKLGSNRETVADVRILASTNRDLKEMVDKGLFREDLYWRLNVVEIHLPPLRERAEDIELFARHFLAQYAERSNKAVPALSPDVREIFREYPWPGNVREMENVLERAFILMESPTLTVDLLPTRLRNLASVVPPPAETGNEPLQKLLGDFERDVILKVLQQENGSRAKAAERLRISLRTLQYKLKEYNIT
ncbi:MAG: sigma-54 dependent transcriptional regulator [Chlamydiota bacterium]